MSSIDQQFVEYIAKSLVGKPEAIKIERRIDEKGVLLELTVDPEDLGRIIGKRGATANSIRSLLRALGTKNEARYNLKIIDNGPPRSDWAKPAAVAAAAPAASAATEPADDDDVSLAEPATEPADEPVAAAPVAADEDWDEEEVKETKSSGDVVSKAREELAEYDDLDV